MRDCVACGNGKSTSASSTASSLCLWSVASALVAACLAGCGGSSSSASNYEVKGKVLLHNGRPLTSGRVTFVSVDGTLPEASADIRSDGGFALSTRDPNEAAAPAKYKVRIEPAGRRDPRKPRLDFPVKYVDEDSSGIEVTLRSDARELEPFKLK